MDEVAAMPRGTSRTMDLSDAGRMRALRFRHYQARVNLLSPDRRAELDQWQRENLIGFGPHKADPSILDWPGWNDAG